MKEALYVHYGHSKFCKELVITMKDSPLGPPKSKPAFGLWASRIDAPYGWIDWCRDQSFDDEEEFGFGDFSCNFKFSLSPNAKILGIHREVTILPYVIKNPDVIHFGFGQTDICDGIDYKEIKSQGFDGMELFMSDDFSLHNSVFNAWDCDSIVIWNPDVIIPKEV